MVVDSGRNLIAGTSISEDKSSPYKIRKAARSQQGQLDSPGCGMEHFAIVDAGHTIFVVPVRIIDHIKVVDVQLYLIMRQRDCELIVVRREVEKVALWTRTPILGEIRDESDMITKQSYHWSRHGDIELPVATGVPKQWRRHSGRDLRGRL